ncbi:MAG: TolC family protein, partial [Candidatus Pacearchaeota archaeon]
LFSEVSKTRLQVGEAAALEKITAESQLYEIRSNILTNEVDLQIYENQLSTLLNSQNKVTSIDSVLNKKNLILTQDSVQLMNNPTLLYFKQQVITARALQLLEKSKLLPELSVGYFNQSLYGTPNYRSPNVYATNSTRFHGITAGISLSLWFKPQLHRIKASQIYENIAQANYNAYQKKLQGEFQSAYQTFLKYQNTLQYYEQNVLPTSKTLQENALINYRSGNIGYLEFSQAVAKSVQTELAYLDLIHKYNQAILFLEYLTGLK